MIASGFYIAENNIMHSKPQYNDFRNALQYEKKKEWKDALQLYEKILATNNKHVDALLNAGAIYSITGNLEKAIQYYEQVLSVKKDIRAIYNLGLAYYKQRKLKKALPYFQECLSIDKDFIKGYILTGYIYIEFKRFNDAKNLINLGLQKFSGNKSLLICLAIVHHYNNETDACMSTLNNILNADPEFSAALKLKARLSISKAVTKAGVENYRKIMNSDPIINDIQHYVDHANNKILQNKLISTKDSLVKKQMKTKQDYLDLSLISLLNGQGNAALNYLLYAAKDNDH